jgi:hypothetical protein
VEREIGRECRDREIGREWRERERENGPLDFVRLKM